MDRRWVLENYWDQRAFRRFAGGFGRVEFALPYPFSRYHWRLTSTTARGHLRWPPSNSSRENRVPGSGVGGRHQFIDRAVRPASNILRQRNARASAFTSVVSAAEAPRGAMPPGVRISFRPPRNSRTASGTRTVSICAATVMLPPSPVRPAPSDPEPDFPAPQASAVRRSRPAPITGTRRTRRRERSMSYREVASTRG